MNDKMNLQSGDSPLTGNALPFGADGTFRILQVSDPQDMVHPRRAMLKMLDRAYDTLHPDLILFTGDNTLGNHLLDFGPLRIETLHRPAFTLRQMRRSLKHILMPAQKRGIPFGMIYGNHDDMNDVTKAEQFALYRAYSRCLPMNGTDETVDCDTYAIPVCGRTGKPVWNLYMLDSAWNDENGQFWRIKKETVEWYKRTGAALAEQNGGKRVPSLMFLHVPLPQTKDLCVPCSENDPGAVKDGDGWVRLDTEKAQGVLGEPVSAGEDPYGLFGAIKENGDVKAVVTGHDHLNCFDGETDGVRLIQSGAASFRCYGGRIRGVRLFTLYEKEPERFDTSYYTYDMLCGRGPAAAARYYWDADEWTATKYKALGGTVLGAAALGTAIRILKRKKKGG